MNNYQKACNEFNEMLERTKTLRCIQSIMRKSTIDSYMTECDCGFKFMPMLTYSKDGNRYCKCGECGELLLLGE